MVDNFQQHLGTAVAHQALDGGVILPEEEHPLFQHRLLQQHLLDALIQLPAGIPGGFFVLRLAQKAHQHGKGGIQIPPAPGKLGGEKAAVVLAGGGSNGVMFRLVGLDDHFPRHIGAPGAACHLG